MSVQIEIDTPGPFYSGSQIQGKLICSFRSREKIRGIKLRAYGDEHTEWWGTESYYNSAERRHETRSVMYTGDNSLFSLESMLYGGQSGEIHVGPGTFTYPFSFLLPSNLPTTFENSHGYIRYSLKGIVDIPWGPDYEDKIHFVVISLIDLNSFPLECFQPTSLADEKTVCCWCCAGGEITVNINIYKTAFVPGENVKLYVALTNMSNSNVESLEAKLVQYIKSHVHSPSHESKQEENTLVSESWSGVGAHGENKYDIEMPIPTNISVPNLDRSSLFEVHYDVEITANIPGCHSDIDLSFSVNLGHIQNSQASGPPPPGGFNPPPQIGPYPYPNADGAAGGGYPYPGAPPANGSSYPTAPPSNGGYPAAPPTSGAPYPGYPAAGGPPNYATVASGEKATYPAGPPSAPAKPKEREAFGDQGGAPSAPVFEQPPPSYEDISRK